MARQANSLKTRLNNAYKALTSHDQVSFGNSNITYSTVFSEGFVFNNHNLDKLVRDGYASNTDVYSIISRIIRTGASIPVIIENKNPNGEIEIIESGNFFDFVHQPNKKQNRFEFTEDALGYQLTTGNELITGTTPSGFSDSLYTTLNLIPPQLTSIKVSGTELFDTTESYEVMFNNKKFKFTQEQVKHIKYFNPTIEGFRSKMGLSPLQAAFNTLMASNEQAVASKSVFKNRGANGMISSEGDNPMTPEESEDLQGTIDHKIGGADKFNKIVGTTARVKYTQFGLSPADMKLIESGVLTMRQLANAYHVDSSNFNDPANKKFNNLKEGQKSLYVNAVLPALDRHYLGYNEFVTPGWNEKDNANYNVRADISSIESLQDDQNKKVDKQAKMSKAITDVVMRVGENKISRESAIETLMISFDMSEDKAIRIMGTTENTNTDGNG